MRHFYIDPSVAKTSLVSIEGSEAHHIRNVLRLNPGDDLKLFDGTGCEYEAVIADMNAEKVELEIRRKLPFKESSLPRIWVAQALLKEKKLDDLVRKLSELGIDSWLPFFSQRTIVRPNNDRLIVRTQRWKRIATESVKQCRRKNVLQISEALSFHKVLEISQPFDLKIIFWEKETAPLNRNIGSKTGIPLKSIIVMLGPEGGFTESEIEMARLNGFVTAGLGPRILRAETATLAAGTLIQYLFGDMGA